MSGRPGFRSHAQDDARHDRTTRRTIWAMAVLFVLGLTSSSTLAARPLTPECWWEGTVLHAINLPDEWSLTLSPYPTGVSNTEDSIVRDYGASFTAYIWTRGGPYEALFKSGKQLNDYKPVAICEP